MTKHNEPNKTTLPDKRTKYGKLESLRQTEGS